MPIYGKIIYNILKLNIVIKGKYIDLIFTFQWYFLKMLYYILPLKFRYAS